MTHRTGMVLSRMAGGGRAGGPRSRSRTGPNVANGETSVNGTHDQVHVARAKAVLGQLPSLKEFVHKQAVVGQYRGFMRAVGMIPDDKFRESSMEEVRKSFRQYASETDAVTTRMAVKEGERRLQQVRSMVGYHDPETTADGDSWLNTKDEEDPRGRVGEDWPWENKDGDDSEQ